MKILITNKRGLEELSLQEFSANTAIISVADFEDDFATLKNAPAHIHRVSFEDVDADVIIDMLGTNGSEEDISKVEKKYHMFSRKQAQDIATFYFSICDTTETLICQCEHGQSRSAAIAAAIMEYRNDNGIEIFSDDRYFPNKVVFRRVLAAMRQAQL